MNQRPEPASGPPGNSQLRPRIPGYLMLALVLLALGAGLWLLMHLRWQSGDIYPPYSTLRSDPLGARVYYESLKRLEGELAQSFTVSRNYKPLSRLSEKTPGATVVMLGLRHDMRLSIEEFAELEELARGGRLALTFFPVAKPPRLSNFLNREDFLTPSQQDEKTEQQDDQSRQNRRREQRRRETDDEQITTPWDLATTFTVSLEQRWNFEFAYSRLPEKQDGSLDAVWAELQTPLDLPDIVSWHSALCFAQLGPEWRVLYARDGKPVIVERQLGRGSLVLAADSYLYSNEALRMEPWPRLLSWTVGNANDIVFDETHLGVAEQDSVGVLARKYRLHGMLAGLLLLAGLYIWKNSTSLVPPLDETRARERRAQAAGRDYFSGMIGLLRRNIKRSDLLATCFREWMKSLKDQPRKLGEKARQVEALVEAEQRRSPNQRNPLAAYQAACRLLRPVIRSNKRPAPDSANVSAATMERWKPQEPNEPQQQTKGESL